MDQEIKKINIEQLKLWTENPRDPVDSSTTDQEIVERALSGKKNKWELKKLAKSMGGFYDHSEIPTVVMKKGVPIVFDGNRRIALGKIKFGIVKTEAIEKNIIPTFPEEIPCNVCSERTAVQNVYRKHAKSGSWDPLERDIFEYEFMDKDKSPFLILNDETGIISNNYHLNKGYVKKEILNESSLDKLGLLTEDEKLFSYHNKHNTSNILADLSCKIKDGTINTRNNRGKVVEVLEPANQALIDQAPRSEIKRFKDKIGSNSGDNNTAESKRITRRKKKTDSEIFGESLYLKIGETSNIYRDILDLDKYYRKNKNKLAGSFASIIRMALRLLVESAASDKEEKMGNYATKYFERAKKKLNDNQKTTLSTHNVTRDSITKLLHIGAHTYGAAKNYKKTIAMSLIIGQILKITHKR